MSSLRVHVIAVFSVAILVVLCAPEAQAQTRPRLVEVDKGLKSAGWKKRSKRKFKKLTTYPTAKAKKAAKRKGARGATKRKKITAARLEALINSRLQNRKGARGAKPKPFKFGKKIATGRRGSRGAKKSVTPEEYAAQLDALDKKARKLRQAWRLEAATKRRYDLYMTGAQSASLLEDDSVGPQVQVQYKAKLRVISYFAEQKDIPLDHVDDVDLALTKLMLIA